MLLMHAFLYSFSFQDESKDDLLSCHDELVGGCVCVGGVYVCVWGGE